MNDKEDPRIVVRPADGEDADVDLDLASEDGMVVLRASADGTCHEVVMTPEEARDLAGSLLGFADDAEHEVDS